MEKLGSPMGIMNSKEAKQHIQNYTSSVEEVLRAVGEIK